MNLKPGALLKNGEYRIEKVLGQGGFGITYLGVQVSLGRKVAIKEFFMKGVCERNATTSQVSISNADNREFALRFREKFLKEARSIASLEHLNIVPVIDVFEYNGTAYYVMKHFGGASLADKVRGGALPEPVAVRYIRQVADALDFVHSKRMMHLDVKPSNILLDENDNVVLIDFGLAKQYDTEGQQTSSTPAGLSHGYAPLEQYKRGGVSVFSPATDIYSLGATLFKLVTGITPPEASDINDDGLPALPAEISPAVRRAIEAAMESRRKDRPQSIAEFLSLLTENSCQRVGESLLSHATSAAEFGRSQNGKNYTASPDDEETQVGMNPPRPSATPTFEKVGELSNGVNDDDETLLNSSSTPRGEVSRSDGGESELSTVKTENARNYTASPDDEETQAGVNPPRPSVTPPFEKVGELSKGIKDSEETRLNSKNVVGNSVSHPEPVSGLQTDTPVAVAGNERTKSWKSLSTILLLLLIAGGYAWFLLGDSGGNKIEDESPVAKNMTFTINGVNFTMVAVEGGTFQMGATSEQENPDSDEKPVHSVTLSDYYIGETEVTQALWQAVMGSNPSYFTGNPQRPVERVRYKDCERFINKLNSLLSNQLPNGRKFRFPTEAQWEYAARGGNRSRGYQHSGSDNFDNVAWYWVNSGSTTHPVKQKQPNELGLYDMNGNVYEWCYDWYSYDYYSNSPQTNPEGPSSGFFRVLRGGCWNYNDDGVANRFYKSPGDRSIDRGLRLAL